MHFKSAFCCEEATSRNRGYRRWSLRFERPGTLPHPVQRNSITNSRRKCDWQACNSFRHSLIIYIVSKIVEPIGEAGWSRLDKTLSPVGDRTSYIARGLISFSAVVCAAARGFLYRGILIIVFQSVIDVFLGENCDPPWRALGRRYWVLCRF